MLCAASQRSMRVLVVPGCTDACFEGCNFCVKLLNRRLAARIIHVAGEDVMEQGGLRDQDRYFLGKMDMPGTVFLSCVLETFVNQCIVIV